MTLLALDFGTKRIGVAVGNLLTGTGQPLAAIVNDGKTVITQIQALVQQYQAQTLIIGLPLTANNEAQAITRKVEGFASLLQKQLTIPLVWVDERYSSVEAERRLAGLRREGQRKSRVTPADKDSMSAVILLEDYCRQIDT